VLWDTSSYPAKILEGRVLVLYPDDPSLQDIIL
jgi:hypothetical protein